MDQDQCMWIVLQSSRVMYETLEFRRDITSENFRNKAQLTQHFLRVKETIGDSTASTGREAKLVDTMNIHTTYFRAIRA